VASERELSDQLVRFGRLCYERHLLVAMDGNLSARLDNGHVLCTQAGCHKGLLTKDHLVVIDLDGNKVRGRGRPTSEMAMHLTCYRERPDCQAVIHAHPPLAIAFTIANQTLASCVLPEVLLTLGTVPTVDYETTGTQALADKIGPYIREHDAILMDRHGAVCLGTSVLEAFCRLETVEHTALITKAARDMGHVKTLPAEEAVHLRSMGLKRYGGPPAVVARADEPGAGLPEACLGCGGCANPKPTGIAPPGGFKVLRVVSPDPSERRALEDMVEEEVLKALRPRGM